MSNPYNDPIVNPKIERLLKRKELRTGKCKYCGSVCAITKDHIHPKSRGGSSYLDNLQPLCRYCNQKKSNKTELELKVIFSDIKKRGVWHDWEKPFAGWIDWLEIVCKERKYTCPLFESVNV